MHALDDRAAWLLASGPGDKSRIYHTTDGGRHWTLQLTNPDAAGFLDAIAFWDAKRALALGDPVGGRFVLFATEDGGDHWTRRDGPAAFPGEGAFAASGTCLIVTGSHDAWFATGGTHARIFHSTDNGITWTASPTPIRHDGPGAGIFSLAFSPDGRGVAVGGDYTHPESAEMNAAITDGAHPWTVQPARPAGYPLRRRLHSVTPRVDRRGHVGIGHLHRRRTNVEAVRPRILQRPLVPLRRRA